MMLGVTATGLDAEKLAETLRAVRDAPPGTRAREVAVKRLWVVLYPVLRRFAHARLADSEIAQDATQEAFVNIERNVDACEALDLPAAAGRVRAWVFRIAANGVVNALRQAEGGRRKAGDEPHLDVSGPEVEPPPEPTTELPELETLGARAYVLARRHAFALMRTREPGDLYSAAKEAEVTSDSEKLRRDLDVWKRVRLQGLDTHSVGQALGYVGPVERIRFKVSKQAQRGGLAMKFGALAAARAERDPELARTLESQASVYDKPGSKL